MNWTQAYCVAGEDFDDFIIGLAAQKFAMPELEDFYRVITK